MTIKIYLILSYFAFGACPSTPSGPFLPACVPPWFSQSFGDDVDTAEGHNSSSLLWGCYGNTNTSGVDSGRRGQHRIRGDRTYGFAADGLKEGMWDVKVGNWFFAAAAAGKNGQLDVGRAGGGTLQAFCPNQAGGVYKLWLGDSHLQASPLVLH